MKKRSKIAGGRLVCPDFLSFAKARKTTLDFGSRGIIIVVEGEEVQSLKHGLAQLCDKCVTF